MKNPRIEATPAVMAGIRRGEALGIAFALALLMLTTVGTGARFVQICIHTEGKALRRELGKKDESASSPSEESASFHWRKCLQRVEAGLQGLGMTQRQVQVSLGIACQETYREIAKRLRVDERTIRDHAASAFRKVGCTRKADFFLCALAAIEAAEKKASGRPMTG